MQTWTDKHMKQNTRYVTLSALTLAMGICSASSFALQKMSDTEMSEAQGQALLTMAYTNPSGSGTGANYLDYGYYKLGLEAEMELNANIKSLQLGCGGINGAGDCDIDISNLALSGPADTKSADNTPQWSKGRANTSAKLTNPFIEFAIKNPTNASTREVVGFRLSAEKILGHLSAGVANDIDNTTGKSKGGGINTFSGFLQVAPTPVKAFTQNAMFGTRTDQIIHAKITALRADRTVTTNTNAMAEGTNTYKNPPEPFDGGFFLGAFTQAGGYYDPQQQKRIWGINVPRQDINFNFPQTAVTGNRMSQLNLVVKDVGIPSIAIGANSGALQLRMDEGIVGLANDPIFYMGAKGTTAAGCAANRNNSDCSYIDNLKVNVTVKQNFNLIHNLPISSSGYLSLQNQALRWPGSETADIAQRGWWMSFKDPLDFGALNPTTAIPMDDVLPQIATFITNYLSENNISLGFGASLGAGIGAPVHKGLGSIALADDARAVLTLQNLLLDGHQNVGSNCWGNLKFC